VKVRKKTPLTLKHFNDFLKLLPGRSDSPISWTLGIQERKKAAADEALPFKDQANIREQEAEEWKERIKDLKKAKAIDEAAITEVEEKLATLMKEAMNAAAKAKEIEDSI
jgi:hypothetical protein